MTLHREENVDNKKILSSFLNAFESVYSVFNYQIICPLHPRTKKRLEDNNLFDMKGKNLKIIKPLGFFDFIFLEKNAYCVMTDSGTVQEECSIFGVPNITLRDTTERPETIESSSNMITSHDISIIINAIRLSVKPRKNCYPRWL